MARRKGRKGKLNPSKRTKPQQSKSTNGLDVDAGGIEVSATVSEFDGTTVDVVAGFDISPLELNFDYDPTASTLSGGIEVGLPGDLIGITGGISVDFDTGEVTAITGGVAIAGLEGEIEKGVGEYSCRTVTTVTFFGIGYSVTQDNCDYGEDTQESGGQFDGEPGPWDDFSGGPPERNNVYCESPSCGYCPAGLEKLNQIITINYLYVDDALVRVNRVVVTPEDEESYLEPIGLMLMKKGILLPKSWFENITPVENFSGIRRSFVRGTWTNPAGGDGWGFYTDSSGWPPTSVSTGIAPFSAKTETTEGDGGRIVSVTKVYKAVRVKEIFYDKPFYERWGFIKNVPARRSNALRVLGCVRGGPPPPPPLPPLRRPNYRPVPIRSRYNPMKEECCQAILELLTGVANVTGVAEGYQYPVPIEIDGRRVEAFNAIHFLALQQQYMSGLLGDKKNNKPLFPLEVYVHDSVTSKPKKIEVKNITELLMLLGNSSGYKEKPIALTLTLEKDSREFSYRSTGDMLVDLVKTLAPHKLLYGNKDEGYVVPNEQLFPGGKGYQSTKDYPGILTRQFSATQRYGFDSPIYIEVEDANPAVEGDQEAGFEVENLAGAIEKLLYNAVETRNDVDALTNINVRESYLLSRVYQIVVRLWYRVTAILDGLGIATRQQKVDVPCEFNPFAGVQFKRGFRPSEDDDDLDLTPTPDNLDLHDDDTTEKMLPELLKNSSLPQSVDEFKKKTPSIFKLLLGKK